MNIFSKLPEEIIRENILPYSYCLQPEELCADIKSFYLTRRTLYEIYETKWAHTDDPIKLLDVDITRYMNHDIPTTRGCTYRYLSVWKKLYYFSDKRNPVIKITTDKINSKNPPQTNINVKLGLLTNSQRESVLLFVTKK